MKTDFKIAGMVGVLGAALRAVAVPPVVADVDGVNFARALHLFDPLAQAPHLPGYPVYVAAARLFHALGAPETWALALPAIVAWVPASLLLYSGARRLLGAPAAMGAVVVASLAPGAVVAGGWPGSDGFGFALLVGSLGLLASAGWGAVAAGVGLGLVLGVRLSWAPLVAGIGLLAVLSRREEAPRLLAGGALGIAVWLAPLAVVMGPVELWTHSLGFASGHASEWGGTAVSGAGVGLAARGLRVGWDLWSAGLGAAWPGAAPLASSDVATGAAGVLLALGAAVALARAPRVFGWLLLAVLPYAAWVWLGQNVLKPRHVVPLLPFLGAALGAGLAAWSRRPAVAASLAALLVAAALPLAWTQGRQAAPNARVVEWVVAHHAPAGLQLFTGEEARLFQHRAPMYRADRPASAAVTERESARLRAAGVRVLCTSSAPGCADGPAWRPLASFRAPEVARGPDASVTVYERVSL